VQQMTRACFVVLVLVAIGLAEAGTAVHAAQDGGRARTVWDGIYTAEQAQRGQALFDTRCGHCHADDLGGGEGPALVGDGFMRNWFERTVQSLLTHILTTMPSDEPGSLSGDEGAALIGFVLSANGVPAGSDLLEPDPNVLASILIVGEDGPGPVPNFSLVRVVGCLSRGPASAWGLTRGTEPVRAQDGGGPVDDADAVVRALVGAPLGTQTFGLIDAAYWRPDPLEGQKVVVEGLLIRHEEQVRVNVTMLSGTGASCEP
jgi:mono/diheme cytochrome c family protein